VLHEIFSLQKIKEIMMVGPYNIVSKYGKRLSQNRNLQKKHFTSVKFKTFIIKVFFTIYMKPPFRLPPIQESILRGILQRLLNPEEDDYPHLFPTLRNQALPKQMNLNGLDARIFSIPTVVLSKIYKQAMTLRFEEFHKRLEELQLVEHTIIQHMATLYFHCMILKRLQKKIDKLEPTNGYSLDIGFLYAMGVVCLLLLLYYNIYFYYNILLF